MPPSVNIDRIRAELRAFARIGYRSDGSIDRLAFTRSDLRARQLLMHRLRTLHFTPRVDAIGNIFGRMCSAHDRDAPPVLIGSHLDTVPGGGRFDGSAGIVAALEIAAVLDETNYVPRRPVEIVSFACEESSRFRRAMLGSGLVAGTWTPAEVLELRDMRGVSLQQVLLRFGLQPDQLESVARRRGEYEAYLELHIEQGRVLEEMQSTLGIVEGIAAPTRLNVDLVGRADHSGATPMNLRSDALCGAAEIVLAIEEVARSFTSVVATVGVIRAEPNVMNVVPGQTSLGIDVRSIKTSDKAEAVATIRQRISGITKARGLRYSEQLLSDEKPVTLNSHLIDLLETCASRRQLRSLRMNSGAGHDAMQMAAICSVGMVLVPSRAGISHNRDEWTSAEDIAMGAQVLFDAIVSITG